MRWTGWAVWMAVLAAGILPGSSARAQDDLSGHWEGSIQLPNLNLAVKVDLAQAGGAWSGTIDIPMQGATGVALEKVSVEGDAVSFAIAGIPGSPTFTGRFALGKITGDFTQSGQTFPFMLGRETGKAPARPQTPRPPFPYTSREVTYSHDGITLAGTLTVPDGSGPFPAVLMITGSGPQDRDETVFDHKPFWVIADRLSRHGVAVLRVDDRGVGGTSAGPEGATSADFAGDVKAGVDFLLARTEVRKDAVGLAGHSEGGLIAPLVASQDPDVAFVILMAAPAVPGDDILAAQSELLARAAGMSKDEARQRAELNRELTALVKTDADSATLAAEARKVIRKQLEILTPEEREELGDGLDRMIDDQLASLTSPWMRYFITYDPRPALAALKVPVLALYGEKDLQVPPDQSVPELEKALKRAGNRDVTVRVYPKLNHLFQTADTGTVAEYYTIEETVNDAVLDKMESWINERFGPGKAGKK